MIRLLVLILLVLVPGTSAQDDPSRDLARAKMDERQVLSELADLDKELVTVEQELAGLRRRADDLDQQRIASEDALSASRVGLDRLRSEVADHCRALYRLNRRGIARIIFSADDPADLRRRTRYLLAILKSDRVRFRRFLDQVERKQAALGRVESDRAALSALQAEVRLRESTVRDTRARKLGLLEEVRTRRSLALAALADRESSSRSLGRDAGSWTPTPDAAPLDGPDIRTLKGKLPCPTSGTLMRGYGTYTDPSSGTRTKNKGIDIQATRYTPIRAVADGYVATTRNVRGWGLTVVLDHGNDVTTVYTHLVSVEVRPGQRVPAGEKIGLVGETGVTDDLGPRLHFEVKYHGTSQNPTRWLRRGCIQGA